MEHIWQSSQEHASGSLNVAEDVSRLASATYLGAVLHLPVSNSFEKVVPVRRSTNLSNLTKDFSQPLGRGSLGRCAAPGHALSLYMHQASLHNGIWPELMDDSDHIRVAINREAKRAQSSRYQMLKEFLQLRLRILGDTVLTGYNHVGPSIHQGNKAAGAMQERTIKDEVLAFTQTQYRLGCWVFHMVINHAIKLPWAVSDLAHQLSYRVTFHNPQPEPFLCFDSYVDFITPTTRVSTGPTEPTLFPFSIMTVSPEYA